MAKVETTTKRFKEGIALSGDKTEIHWESTGYLSVRLLDEFGEVPLAGRECRVQVPGEGEVVLESDDDGWVRHPDVPFQDYELDLGEGAKVHVPAVASPEDRHHRHVPGVRFSFVNLALCLDDGSPVANTEITVEGPDGEQLRLMTDEHGFARDPTPRPMGTYTITASRRRATAELATRRNGLSVITLTEEAT